MLPVLMETFSLHYANVTVGNPSSWFLVALDTGSDLFWLPCDCSSCVSALRSSSGQVIELLHWPQKRRKKCKTIFNPRKNYNIRDLLCICVIRDKCCYIFILLVKIKVEIGQQEERP